MSSASAEGVSNEASSRYPRPLTVTGGTGGYQNARGQVRVVQETVDQAEVTFRIQW